MTELLNNIKGLLDEAIEYEHNLMNTYAKLTRTYDGLGNEKFADVAGLKKPNFFEFMRGEKVNKEELENIKFAIETQIKHNEDRRKKEEKLERKLGS